MTDDLTDDDRIKLLKAIWPEECSLIGDYQLSRIVSRQVNVTRPEGGFNFDIVPFVQIITAGLSLLAAFVSYREKAKGNHKTVARANDQDEILALIRYVSESAEKRSELDHATIELFAREFVKLKKYTD